MTLLSQNDVRKSNYVGNVHYCVTINVSLRLYHDSFICTQNIVHQQYHIGDIHKSVMIQVAQNGASILHRTNGKACKAVGIVDYAYSVCP